MFIKKSENSQYIHHPSPIKELPIVFLLIKQTCNHRCAMCDIWKTRDKSEIGVDDILEIIPELKQMHVREIILTGGEPLMNSEFADVVGILNSNGFILRVVTNGMLLEKHAKVIAENVASVRVSLDGPKAIHDRIRGIRNAFSRLSEGVQELRHYNPQLRIGARCTVQNQNQGFLAETLDAAKSMKLNYLSFNGVDIGTESYNRDSSWLDEQGQDVMIPVNNLTKLESEINKLIADYSDDFDSGFILESPERLTETLLQHSMHNAQHGRASYVPCNAPWVSAVIEPNRKVRPCFFHAGYEHESDSLVTTINSEQASQFRQQLDVNTNKTCQNCACKMHLYTCTCGWSDYGEACNPTCCGRSY
ncbi:radical SAM protein [Vibrio hangzhouensis]|uniref:radical SAM protein n=1 Tax=Vibrio hangzhouensis TaxID=462991 RepID=UPI001C969051|nr:radical SAM protein [Vibrio hangzhouensis]MBY6197723.1 radical SAM protein [Vibrio hangzhouensis]